MRYKENRRLWSTMCHFNVAMFTNHIHGYDESLSKEIVQHWEGNKFVIGKVSCRFEEDSIAQLIGLPTMGRHL